MKQLEKEFTGRGQVKDFEFKQMIETNLGFIYEVNTGVSKYYEVFKRKENTLYNCISYPSNKAFGIWAWTCFDLGKAAARLESFKEAEKIES